MIADCVLANFVLLLHFFQNAGHIIAEPHTKVKRWGALGLAVLIRSELAHAKERPGTRSGTQLWSFLGPFLE